MMVESVQLNWDYCPSEIVYIILKEMDIRTFFNCRCVCKRWKQIADDIGQDHKIWEKFCKEEYPEFYLDFLRKSQLPWINVYKNIQLWPKIKNSVQSIDGSISYNHLQIFNICVYKDKLIVVCNTCIKYFLISELTLIKTVGRICLDCQENEHMNLELKPNRTLCLYGKSEPSDFFVNPLPFNENHNVACYSLQDDQCYFIDMRKTALWICEWRNNTWKEIFLARYYGVAFILDMSICKKEVYILVQGGDIYKVTSNEKRFFKVCSTVLPPFTNIAFLFKKYNVLVPVFNKKLTTVDSLHGHSSMQVPGLNCFMEHAGMLILGNVNYGIQIYDKNDLMTPIHEIQIKDVANNGSSSIIAIDVCEYRHRHCIIVSTNSTVHVISCSHPHSKVSEEIYKIFCTK